MTHPIERIDGFYIGYRPIHGTNGADSVLLDHNSGQSKHSNGKSSLPSISASSSDPSSSLIPSYTFKTMYDLSKYSTNGLNQTHQIGLSSKFTSTTTNDNSNTNNNNNNNNITTFCEVISVDDDTADNLLTPGMVNNDFLYGHSKKYGAAHRQQNHNSNKNGKLEQIRCTYEFLLASLSRKTKYGSVKKTIVIITKFN